MWNSPDILMQMCQISTSCITQWSLQVINPYWAALQPHQNSPALTPPAFSSMAAEPVEYSYLDWSSPPTGCPALASCTYPSPFSPSAGQQRAEFQCSHRQTQRRCPPHGLLNNTGIHTLGKPTGSRHTALLASLFSFLKALPLFSSTLSLPARLPALLKKFSLSRWNETNDKCSWRPPSTPPSTPPSKSIMKHNQYSAD